MKKRGTLKAWVVLTIALFVESVVAVGVCLVLTGSKNRALNALDSKNNAALQAYRNAQYRKLDENSDDFEVNKKNIDKTYKHEYYQNEASEEDRNKYNSIRKTQDNLTKATLASSVTGIVGFLGVYKTADKIDDSSEKKKSKKSSKTQGKEK